MIVALVVSHFLGSELKYVNTRIYRGKRIIFVAYVEEPLYNYRNWPRL